MPASPKARCASCGAPVRAKDRFCASCGTPIAAAQAAQPTLATPASASLQVPSAAAESLQEQRKVVTILFADLSGSTPLAERLDPEDLRGILGSYFGVLARQIQRYEGTIDKYIGDAVMAVFGAPISHEDDAERALRAALAMQASIVRLNDDLDRRHGVRLALRIGVNTGEVVAGMLAGDVQHAYTVVGDAVNTAQRLESVAPLGEVLASESTRRLVLHRFELERREPVTLKGKAEPVVTYRVVRVLEDGVEPDATPFVGRAAELAHLEALLERARGGRGQVVHLVGDAGVGKSRLLSELRAALPGGIDRMTARAASYEQGVAYALVADFIRGAFGIHAAGEEDAARTALAAGLARYGVPATPAVVDVVLESIGYAARAEASLDPSRKRAILVGFLRTMLHRAALRAPFVLTAEDLHWVDDASRGVLAELVGEAPELPCLFVTTSRPGWAPPWDAERIEVPALDDSEAAELVGGMLERAVGPQLLRQVVARGGGNPFFIEELVRELQRAGGDALAPVGGAESLPATIQDVLEARLERLPEAASRVVRPAAVIGRTFWHRLLGQLLPGGPVSEGLGVLETESLITAQATSPELTYVFRQALIRDAAYQIQLQSVRRRTHTAVGEAIERIYADRVDEFVDLLAYHYERGDDGARALPWLLRAADRAKGLFANEEALSLYGRALAHAVDGDGPLAAGSILERHGDVLALVGRYDDALASYAAAGERGTVDPPRLARLERKAGAVLLRTGDSERADAAFARGLDRLGDVRDAEAARLEIERGQLRWRLGDYAGARDRLSRAVEMADRIGDDSVRAEALKELGNVAYLAGVRGDAFESWTASLAVYERSGDLAGRANLKSNLGAFHRRAGDWGAALGALEESLALRERMGDPWGIGMAHNNIAEVHRSRGDLGAAIAAYERALERWRPIGNRDGVALALTGLGAAHAEAGDPARGLAELREAEALWRGLGSTTYLPELYRFVASAELADGDLGAAETAIARSIAVAEAAGARHHVAAARRVQAEICAARGDRDAARTLLDAAIAALRELAEPVELARAEAARARL